MGTIGSEAIATVCPFLRLTSCAQKRVTVHRTRPKRLMKKTRRECL